MSSPIVQAIKQICEEKNISYESVIGAIELALASAYRKDFGDKMQNLKVEFNAETGGIRVFDVKTVVADELAEAYQKEMEERQKMREAGIEPPMSAVSSQQSAVSGQPTAESGEQTAEVEPRFHPKMNISLSNAKKIKSDAQIGETLIQELSVPGEFGRMAAQTAKQVIMQRIREVEREAVFGEFKSREGQVITATVQRREGRVVLIDLGKATGVMLPEDQIEMERYNPGQRIKVYVKSVSLTTKGPEILLSRTSREVVRRLFETEIPEIGSGVVEIKAIAREAGARAKIAVRSFAENIDPIGSCIGQRGARIQTIIAELGGEKIDVIAWDENPVVYISNALSPAKAKDVKLNEEAKIATVVVKADQLSLAIGRGGQNVRLATELTGWRIDILEETPSGEVKEVITGSEESAKPVATDEEKEAKKEAAEETLEKVEMGEKKEG
jgi:N utilization substance protein A